MKIFSLKNASLLLILTLIILISFSCIASAESIENLTSADVSGDERYVTIILHAGDQGYFGDDTSFMDYLYITKMEIDIMHWDGMTKMVSLLDIH